MKRFIKVAGLGVLTAASFIVGAMETGYADQLKWKTISDSYLELVADPVADAGKNEPQPFDYLQRIMTTRLVYKRLVIDLNGDSVKDVLVSEPGFNALRYENYSVYLSDGQQFGRCHSGIDIGGGVYAGHPAGPDQVALITWINDSASGGGIWAYRAVDKRLEVSTLDYGPDLLKEGGSTFSELEKKYETLYPDVIPISVLETLYAVQKDVKTYLDEREAAVFPDPQQDYCSRHRTPYGKPAEEGRELFRLDVDLNRDGQVDVQLFSSTSERAVDFGYMWESYTAGSGGYRWQRDTQLMHLECRVKAGELIGYATGQNEDAARIKYGIENGRFVWRGEETLDVSAGAGPFDSLPAGYTVVKATRVPFPMS